MKGLRFRQGQIDNHRIRLVEYTKEMPQHWCEKGHVGYVLEGEMKIRFAEETHLLKSGDGIVIPSGPEHQHKAISVSDVVKVVYFETP